MGLGRKANQVLFYCLFALLSFQCKSLCFYCAYQVYIIDFGLAKRYRDATTNRHIPYRYSIAVFSYGLFWFLDIYMNYTFRGTYLRNNKNKHIETSFFMQ